MVTLKRNYTRRTIKVLFAWSGNECAFPNCSNPVVKSETESSDELVVAQICHIYSISEDGPRGRNDLTEKELNSHENLILFCPTHHVIVDGQHEDYPADVLKEWKQKHEAKYKYRITADDKSKLLEIDSLMQFPRELVDTKIKQEISKLRKVRFVKEFNANWFCEVIANKILKGEFTGGSDKIRCWALAWCARILSRTEKAKFAEEVLNYAKSIGYCPEVTIATSFFHSERGDKKKALKILAEMDSPLSSTAAFQIVAHHDGPNEAIEWFNKVGLNASNIDSDGKIVLLIFLHEIGDWERASKIAKKLKNADFEEAPILHHLKAKTLLMITVPNELRSPIIHQVPFDASSFPLSADAEAIENRREALSHYILSSNFAKEINCPNVQAIEEEVALWIELRDPEKSESGRKKLQDRLQDEKSALHLVNLGLQFGIHLNIDAVEREIERQIAINDGMTADTAIARFSLAFDEKSPKDVAKYIERYRNQLSEFIDKKSLISLEIEALSKAGLTDLAEKRLSDLIVVGISEAEKGILQRIISESQTINTVQLWKKQFKETDKLIDLISLVEELAKQEEWEDLYKYGSELFNRTKSLHAVEMLSRAFYNSQRYGRLANFLRTNSIYLKQSQKLHLLYCWALFYEGHFLETQSELESLSEFSEDPNYRTLKMNLGIAIGDWDSLIEIIAEESRNKKQRDAVELINAAKIGLHLKSPHAKELLYEAAQKGKDNASILAASYFLAVKAGIENDVKVTEWLHNAAELSNEDGPIKRMSLRDMVELKPEWDRRESEIWRQLSCGEMLISVAGQLMNRSLGELILFPASANISENDPRSRSVIPAYSGVRQPKTVNINEVVGIEATALLTLGILNLLDNVFNNLKNIFIPHSTLTWLFQEKEKATFHQPILIKNAERLRHLLVTGFLKKINPTTFQNSELSIKIGGELALLISEAEKADKVGKQKIVVRSAPVYQMGSLMTEEADLSDYFTVICSCLSIVKKLRAKGQITAEEERKALSFLRLNEKEWPTEPEILDDATLFLDDLSVSHLLYLGMLDKLKLAGFKPVIQSRTISDANKLVLYGNLINEANELIEKIRETVYKEIKNGKVKIGRIFQNDQIKKTSLAENPSVGVLNLVKYCDTIISDDRNLNQHSNIHYDGCSASIVTTVDLINQFNTDGLIIQEKWLEHRTFLRRAGYIFTPIQMDELNSYLDASKVKEETLIETAELKAIRESILQIRMRNWLQLPKEAFWLDSITKTFVKLIKKQWETKLNISIIKARSNWLLNQIDIRGWIHCFADDVAKNILKIGRGALILLLMAPPLEISKNRKDEYFSWIEDSVLSQIKEQEPELYTWILERSFEQIAEISNLEIATENGNE